MSRKFILSLAALGTLASVALVAGSANAMVANHGNGGHGGRGGHISINHVGHPHFRDHRHVHFWRYREHRFVRFGGYVRPVGYARPVVEGTCTCLTKDYTPEGIVVFKDLCTQEMASAPAEGAPAQASEVQAPTNFAGKTYQDYLAANPQAQKN